MVFSWRTGASRFSQISAAASRERDFWAAAVCCGPSSNCKLNGRLTRSRRVQEYEGLRVWLWTGFGAAELPVSCTFILRPQVSNKSDRSTTLGWFCIHFSRDRREAVHMATLRSRQQLGFRRFALLLPSCTRHPTEPGAARSFAQYRGLNH